MMLHRKLEVDILTGKKVLHLSENMMVDFPKSISRKPLNTWMFLKRNSGILLIMQDQNIYGIKKMVTGNYGML